MSGQQDTKRNRKTDASREDAVTAAFARPNLPAHFGDQISNITRSSNGACRLHFCTWSTGDHGQPVHPDTDPIPSRRTLTALAEAPPKALTQLDQPLVAENEESAKALRLEDGL